jgi:hypothetical protein
VQQLQPGPDLLTTLLLAANNLVLGGSQCRPTAGARGAMAVGIAGGGYGKAGPVQSVLREPSM